jgi:hypothetical protein
MSEDLTIKLFPGLVVQRRFNSVPPAQRTTRHLDLLFSSWFWHSLSFFHGGVPMKRFAVVGLACLLSACQSSRADVLPNKPERVADFPSTTAADLSDCVHRTAQSMRSPYVFHLNARADKLEFLIIATREPDTTMRPKLPKLELHLMTKGESTTVEMKESAIGGDHELSHDIWSIVERCVKRMPEHPAEKSTAP